MTKHRKITVASCSPNLYEFNLDILINNVKIILLFNFDLKSIVYINIILNLYL